MPAPTKTPARRAAPKALAAKPVATKPVAARPVAAKSVPQATAKPAPAKPAAAKPAAERSALVKAPAPAAAKSVPVKPAAPVVPAPATVAAAAPRVEAPQVEATPAPAVKPVPVAPVAKAEAPPAPLTLTPVAAVTAVLPPEALPKAVKGVADTGLAQAREAYATIRQSAETLSSGLNTSGEAAARGLQSFSTTMLEQIQSNADATLGFLRALAGVKTLSEAIELQARHARLQFETMTAQAKTLAGIVNKTATETAAPVRKALDATLHRAS
ncbi:phasin family protein [Alsobacter sp. R-9]